MSPWILAAALLGALGVMLGAFGAHGLAARVEPSSLESWRTAVQYHLIHVLLLLALGLYAQQSGRSIALPAGLLCVGIVLFSGSIYALVLGGPRWLGPVTPLGGLALILAWLALVPLARD